MHIVIDIPKYMFDDIHDRYKHPNKGDGITTLEDVVATGILLPKGHGKLIDADLLKNQFPIWVDNFSSHVVNNTISKAPTIIEADREVEE
jgi:hypothetical protein